jgi:hypothetical protein
VGLIQPGESNILQQPLDQKKKSDKRKETERNRNEMKEEKKKNEMPTTRRTSNSLQPCPLSAEI